jgi:hypothetical protein
MATNKATMEVVRDHAAKARRRAHVRAFEGTLIRKSAVALSAAGFGAMKRNGVADDLHGFPWKLGLWLGATLLEGLSHSNVLSNFAAGVSDAAMAVYTANAIATKSLIAGEGAEI